MAKLALSRFKDSPFHERIRLFCVWLAAELWKQRARSESDLQFRRCLIYDRFSVESTNCLGWVRLNL